MPSPAITPEQRAKAKPYEANFRAFGRGLAAFADGPVLKKDGVEVYASPFWTVFNAYLPPRWSDKATPDKIATALRLGQQTGQGMSFIVGPSANEPAVREALLTHGSRCGYWVPFLHRDLSQPIARGKALPGLKLEWIGNLKDLFDKGKHPHPYLGPMTTKLRKTHRDYQQMLCNQGSAKQVIAWMDGKPVGGTLIFAHRGSAGVYDVGVLEPYRGRGIGGLLLLEALREAKRMGLECAVLSAASQAVPLYQRVGFTDAGHYGSYYLGKGRLQKLKLD